MFVAAVRFVVCNVQQSSSQLAGIPLVSSLCFTPV